MARILFVEDEVIIREPLEMVLTLEGFTVDSAANGLEALSLWKRIIMT